MLIIGVTGNIACGKSTVDAMVRDRLGATIIDADQVTHELLRSDSAVREAIVAGFGETVIAEDGEIDRRSLGRLVFSDPQALKRLEAILHPRVRQVIRDRVAALPAGATAVIDAVKLLQGDLGQLADSVWWVIARPDQQLARLIGRGISEHDALSRMSAQPSLDDSRAQVDVIIDNSGTVEETRIQVFAALRQLHDVARLIPAMGPVVEE